MVKRTLLVSGLLAVASCVLTPQHVETRAVSDRATITSTQLAEEEWRIEFVADMGVPATDADRFMPTGSPILAEAERLCPKFYSIADSSVVDVEFNPASQTHIVRSSGIVLCLTEPPPCGGDSL